jgi:hypothetical protein
LITLNPQPLPVIGAIPQVLLLCSRENLNARQAEHIVGLCGAIDDWRAFVEQAEFRLILPLVHRHLARLHPAGVPAEVMADLKERTLRTVLRNLTVAAVHPRLVREVLEPLRVPYVFNKGPTLAYRYYREPGLRMARDIDLLVPRRDLVRVGQRLREVGFSSHEDPAWAGDDALQFRARFLGLMAWVSPEGVLVEIPSSLDAEWDRLPTDEIIAEAESVAIGGAPIRVVRGPDFFTYLCRHHTRHHWVRLHWIADLDAIFHSPGFDLASAKAQARRRGFGRTVDAACAIHRAAAESEPWNAAFDDPFAREVFRHCLMNLEGDYEQERELRAAFPTTDIDIEPGRRWVRQALWRNLGRFRPSGEDFLHLPLPHRWHGAFYALRPLLWTIRTVRKALRPVG